ncbi:uncharacterized protein LOC141774747 [Sebastes fasciatus]|uniref:uncharacterized protein LOC141774747 n=1 Tax=Sebastes fasciatus TaxID=394691 RepID=UPI003D9F21D1
MRGVSLYLLLGHLLIAGVGSTCVPVQCLRCNATGETQADPCSRCSNSSAQCIDVPSDIPSNCTKDFQVSVNTTGSKVNEGDDITLTCVHNLPDLNLTFGWIYDGEEIQKGRNKSELCLEKVLTNRGGPYICFVNSSCGYYESSPHDVTVENQTVLILVICGVSALVLVLVLGLAMKFKLKRDNAKLKERMRQKAREGQNNAPAPFTPRES